MKTEKQCPLCGKPIGVEDAFCDECQNHVDHQYETEFLDDNNREGNSLTDNEQIAAPVSIEPLTENSTGIQPVDIAPKKKKLSKNIILFLLGCVLIVVIGTISVLRNVESRKSNEIELQYWTRCEEENTPLAYSKYLVSYPNGKYAPEAEKHIREFRNAENEAWLKLKKSTDINDFYVFLRDNPKTPYIEEARDIMDSLMWSSTLKDNSADAYKAYLNNIELGNISGHYKDVASERYNYLSQVKLLEGSELESLKIELDNIFKYWSENDQKELLQVFAPNCNYYGKIMSSTEIVALINKTRNDMDIKSVVLTPKPESISGKKDNAGIYFVQLTFDKKIKYNNKKKKELESTENVDLELNPQFQLLSIKTSAKTN